MQHYCCIRCRINLFFIGAFWSALNPNGQFAIFFGDHGDGRGAAGMLTILGVLWLIIGAVLVPVFYKLFAAKLAAKSAFSSSPNLTARVKAVSKLAQATGGRYSTNIFSISFEFSDGNRKSFQVNALHFNTIVENDIGILTYREQGNYLFFVDFQRLA